MSYLKVKIYLVIVVCVSLCVQLFLAVTSVLLPGGVVLKIKIKVGVL